MIAVSIHFNKRKLILILCAIILIVAVITITIKGVKNSKNVSQNDYNNNYTRIGYLNLCGWDVEETPISEKSITIPTEFNECYKKYNDIQLKQGFDLSNYKGKIVDLYTYKICNYPKEDKKVMAELLVCDGDLIGGTIYENQQNGFQHLLSDTPLL